MSVALAPQSDEAHVPVYLTRFFGREAELDHLARLLNDPVERVITLVGPGGVGKTRLLVEALRQVDETDVLYVDGVAISRAEQLLPEIVDLLEIDRTAGQPIGELLSEHLAGRRLTLVIDNMEHLLAAAIDLAALVRALPGIRIVTTSRAPMHISGEYVLPVDPLATRQRGEPIAAPSVAAQIFIDRAGRTGKMPRPSADDLAMVETICARLDGLPLAIELAAARLRVLSLPALLAVLTNQLSVLTGGPVDVSERHRALRATIGWSYDLLDDDEQRLMRELGVFIESFSLEAVAAVCTPSRRETIDLIELLFDQALLMRSEDDPTGSPRYSMLTSIHSYALEQLRAAGDELVLRERHAAWCLYLAESVAVHLTGPKQHQTIELLNRAMPNLRQGLEFLIERGEQEMALRLATALSRYWLIRNQWDESKRVFAALFAMGEPKPSPVWGAALRAAAHVAETMFDNEPALQLNRRAIEVWEALDDRGGMARSHVDLGNVYNNLGRFDDAVAEFRIGAELADGGVDPRTSLIARGSIAITSLRKGDLIGADRVFFDLMPDLRSLGDLWLLSTCLSNAAVARQRLHDWAGSRTLLEESLAIREQLGDEYGVGVTLINLCDVMNDPVGAEQQSRRVLELARRIAAPDLAAAASANLAEATINRGEWAVAAMHYVDALEGYVTVNDEMAQADIVGLIAELGVERDPVAATRLLGAAQGEQERHGVQPTGPAADRVATIRTRLRQALGDASFDRELAVGMQSSLADARIDAVAMARSSSVTPTRTSPKPPAPPAGVLTARELDVLKLIVEGKTDRQIAEALFITPKTANHHVTRILAKLECRNRAAATALAFQRGLV
jgi:predicted ATPase/DNA-binding NarL/FixJ family response regulator